MQSQPEPISETSGGRWGGQALPLRLRWLLRAARRSWQGYATAIGILGLGAGITLAAVAVLNGVVFHALPYRKADSLYEVRKLWHPPWAEGGETTKLTTFDECRAWFSLTNLIAGVGARYASEEVLLHGKQTFPCSCTAISADLPGMLGLRIAEGRGFRPEDFQASSENVAVVTRTAALKWFGTAAGGIGAAVNLKGKPYRIIGVLEDNPRFLDPADVLVPLILSLRDNGIAEVMVELRRREAVDYTEHMLAEAAKQSGGDNLHKEFRLVRMGVARLETVRDAVTAFVICSVATLLLCSLNTSLLMVGQALQQEQETALVLALGASRAWVLWQSILQALLIGLAAIPAGLVLAQLPVLRIRDLLPELPWVLRVRLDWEPTLIGTVLVLGVTIVAGIGVGLWRLSLSKRKLLMQGAGIIGTRRRRHAAEGLVTLQIAVGVALGATALFHARSYAAKVRSDLGFKPEGVVSVVVELPEDRYPTRESRAAFFRDLMRGLGTLQGVESLGLCGTLPLTGIGGGATLSVEGAMRAAVGSDRIQVAYANVSEKYFETLRIPLKQGRSLKDSDAMPKPSVAVVNEAFRHKFAPTNEILGMQVGTMTIVGIVGDVKGDMDWPVEPQVFGSYLEGDNRIGCVALRVTGSVRSVAAACRTVIQRQDPDPGIATIASLNQRLAERLLPFRTGMLVTTAFAVAGMILGSAGVYGIVVLQVAERSREVAIRIALGATRPGIVGLVLRRTLPVLALGVFFGALACFWLRGILQSVVTLNEGLNAYDIAAGALAMAAAGLAASVSPIRGASKRNPWTDIRASAT